MNVLKLLRRRLRRVKRKVVIWFKRKCHQAFVCPVSYEFKAQICAQDKFFIQKYIEHYAKGLILVDSHLIGDCDERFYVRKIDDIRKSIKRYGGRPGPCGAILVTTVMIYHKFGIPYGAARTLAIEFYYSSKRNGHNANDNASTLR